MNGENIKVQNEKNFIYTHKERTDIYIVLIIYISMYSSVQFENRPYIYINSRFNIINIIIIKKCKFMFQQKKK